MSDAFYNALCDHQHFEGYEEGYKDGYKAGKRDAASPWHRVEEPPKKDGKYLVCWKDGGGFCYDTAWWTSVGTWSLSHWTGVTVTHWMTVEPPKEDA